ncbi:MAG: hypothetical protein NC184_07520 [Roseburia sp.]|nr:hypothetical protein [Roseburia sp.]
MKKFLGMLATVITCICLGCAFLGCSGSSSGSDSGSEGNGGGSGGSTGGTGGGTGSTGSGTGGTGSTGSGSGESGDVGGTGGTGGGDTPVSGFKVTFSCDSNVSVRVYNTQNMSGAGTQATEAYARDGSTGDPLSDGNGQVNFVLVFNSGYELGSMTVTPAAGVGYKNLKGSADTGVANGYRITKITDDLTVTVTSASSQAQEDLSNGYKVTFDCDSNVTVKAFDTQDMTGSGVAVTEAYSRDSATGVLLKNGKGQVNYKLEFASGYVLDDIAIAGNYGNLKPPYETETGGYRITKIAGNLTVRITSKPQSQQENLSNGFRVDFECTHAKVYVYETQDYSGAGTLTNTAYSRRDVTGALLKDGNGQVNFKVVCDDGYSFAGFKTSDIAGIYGNIKTPIDTGAAGVYRITKIGGNLTIRVAATQDA